MLGSIMGWEQLLGGLGIIIRKMKSQGGSRKKKCRAHSLAYQFIWQRLEPSQDRQVQDRTERFPAGTRGYRSGELASSRLTPRSHPPAHTSVKPA